MEIFAKLFESFRFFVYQGFDRMSLRGLLTVSAILPVQSVGDVPGRSCRPKAACL